MLPSKSEMEMGSRKKENCNHGCDGEEDVYNNVFENASCAAITLHDLAKRPHLTSA